MSLPQLTGQKILVTGVTGQVAGPLARNLVAAGNTVYGTSRFATEEAREKVADDGVIPIQIDMETASYDEIPDGLDYVINMAVAKSQDFERDLAANAEGVAFMIERVKGVKAFFHCSSCAVYEPNGQEPHKETDPLGDNHRKMGFMPTYSISKIASESAVKYASKRFGVPAVIARLDVPYGPTHGWPQMMVTLAEMGIPTPVHPEGPNTHCFLWDDDMLSSLPYLIAQADVPPPVFNWCSPEIVSVEEWCQELTKLTGVEIPLVQTEACVPPNPVDASKLLSLGWEPKMSWRDGFREMCATCFPDKFKG
ncbi:MAG: hypothetical protein RLZZ31_1343 [Actinomycetota bacterium]